MKRNVLVKMVVSIIAVVILSGCTINITRPTEATTATTTAATTEITTTTAEYTTSASKITAKSSTTKKKTTTSKKTTTTTKPVHTHSYSKQIVAATCAEKGYTKYVCACGHNYTADYTNPSHTFSKYVCTKCGEVDKSHAYEYLVEWVKKNGEVNGEYVSIHEYEHNEDSSWQFGLVYSASGGYVYISASFYDLVDERNDFYTSINLSSDAENFKYYSAAGSLDNTLAYATGKINGKEHTEKSPISCDVYSGDSYYRNTFFENTRIMSKAAILFLDEYIDENIPEIDITDVGFANF